MIVSRANLRVSFFGGGTDYAQWYNTHGGAILGGAINKYVYVCLHDGNISAFWDLPNKSGLASSSAYTVALLRSCSNLTNLEISKMATILEIEKTGGMVGSQDQFLCAMGGFHHLKFSEHGIKDFPITQDIVTPLQDYLMLFDTNQYRRNGDIIPSQLQEMTAHEDIYKHMAEMPGQGVTLLKEKDYQRFGELLGVAWELKKQVAPKATTPQIDSIYEKAIKAGAIGGKLLGGGGGGFIVFVVEPDKQIAVKQALSGLDNHPFKFENEGTKVVYHDNR